MISQATQLVVYWGCTKLGKGARESLVFVACGVLRERLCFEDPNLKLVDFSFYFRIFDCYPQKRTKELGWPFSETCTVFHPKELSN